MADRKSASKAKAASAVAPPAAYADGYEGLNWQLYDRVRPNQREAGATGAGLVDYTVWLDVVRARPESARQDVGLPGQPFR